MYNYEWDQETGGYILTTALSGVTKEVRPVYWEELSYLKMDSLYGWKYPHCVEPLLWAEGRRYIYRGTTVAETRKGGLYQAAEIHNAIENLILVPVAVEEMIQKNKGMIDYLVQRTLKSIYDVYQAYQHKVDMVYAAFSGGKDSVVMLDLVQRALPADSFEVVFGDTTMELSDTYANVDKAKQLWSGLNWHTARTDYDATQSWKLIGPPARTIRWCCGVHKSAPSILKIKEILAKKKGCAEREITGFKVLAYTGVRAEESEARSNYSLVADGDKHTVQVNCNPILEWGSCEVFVYYFDRNLPLNDAYRKGLHRVGCKLCPMSSGWSDMIQMGFYSHELNEFVQIIRDSISKEFSTEQEWMEYISEGGWKKRAGGNILRNGQQKVILIKSKEQERLIIREPSYSWQKWLKALGDFTEIEAGVYSIKHGGVTLLFTVEEADSATTITYTAPQATKESARFFRLFKNAILKSAYCINCKECMAECPTGALLITNDDVLIDKCRHCGKCLEKYKGCVVARSMMTTGDGNMDIANIDRYKTFGFRKEWLSLFFEDTTGFWQSQRLGKDMFYAFSRWAREMEVIDDNKTATDFSALIQKLDVEDPALWALLFVNMGYNSPIVTWYLTNTHSGETYSTDSLIQMLGEGLKERTRKNAIASLKDLMKSTPIGEEIGAGLPRMKGRSVVSLSRIPWADPNDVVILYSLYRFAEASDGLYSFLLSDLLDDTVERKGLSPRTLFGLEEDVLRPMLQGLSNSIGSGYISVDFNKGIMDNIYLNSEVSSMDILKLL